MLQVRLKMTHCTNTKIYKDNDDKSTSSTSSRSSMKKIAKYVKKISRVFTTVITQLKNIKEADSQLSDSGDEDKVSHSHSSDINFGTSDFQFAQFYEEFKPCIAILFNRIADFNVGIKTNLNLREVILLYIQLIMDLFFNRVLVEKTTNSKTKIRFKKNDGTMTVSHQETVNDYQNSVWFSENETTNIIAPINLCLQCLVT